MKVREELTVVVDGGTSHYRLCNECMDELHRLGILDAPVIRGTCPTCGGIDNHEGDCNMCRTLGLVRGKACPNCDGTGRGPWVPCPDCADAPVYVIEPAAMEAFKDEVLYQLEVATAMPDIDGRHLDGALGGILQALLPGARVAGEVVRMKYGDHIVADSDRHDAEGALVRVAAGRDIAILATQAREEVENA